MAVTSRPIPAKKESAVITRERLRKQRGTIERLTAWGVLLVSFLGSIALAHGGWPTFGASLVALQPHWGPLLMGAGVQVALTFLEWYYYDRPLIAWGARLGDAATTALGYGPLVVGWLIGKLTSEVLPDPFFVAWGIIGLVSLAVAWYPESRLVD